MNNAPDYDNLAFIPQEEKDLINKATNQLMQANINLLEDNKKLKDLLKECKKWMSIERDFAMPNEKIILQMTLDKIDEVLK